MTVFLSATEPTLGGALVRGLPTRRTDLMEAFQVGAVSALAAAAGCKSTLGWTIDDGIDMTLMHAINGERIPLDVQLKATTNSENFGGPSVSVSLSRKRFDEMRSSNNGVDSILVAMELPADQANWVEVSLPETVLRHGIYWLSLQGLAPRAGVGEHVSVSVPRSNVFDDHVICQIMARIRAGGKP